MNQVKIGKFIAERRKAVTLTQMQLAEKLGITDRAVSKWETGEAKPAIPQLIKLSKIFDVSMDDILESKEQVEKHITKIVITGGPCAGKSTALTWIQAEYTKKGYSVIFVPESATELILAGLYAKNANTAR